MIVQYHTKYQIQLLKISENKIVDSAQITGDVLVDAVFLERKRTILRLGIKKSQN